MVMRPIIRPPRDEWDDAFHEMARQGDDTLLDEPPATRFDLTEWDW